MDIFLNTLEVLGSFAGIIAVAAAFGKIAEKLSGRK